MHGERVGGEWVPPRRHTVKPYLVCTPSSPMPHCQTVSTYLPTYLSPCTVVLAVVAACGICIQDVLEEDGCKGRFQQVGGRIHGPTGGDGLRLPAFQAEGPLAAVPVGGNTRRPIGKQHICGVH